MPRTALPARERMIRSAALLVREQGARATSIDDVLRHSGAPRGSVYHHFPGGRDQLLRETTAFAGGVVEARIGAAVADDPLAALDEVLHRYEQELIATDYRAGCPVLAVAIEARESDDDGVQAAAGDVFRSWTQAIAEHLRRGGIAADRAEAVAVLGLAAAEGALAIARAERDLGPLRRVRAEIGAMVERERRDSETTETGGDR